MNRPWMPFHTRDWLDSKELRRCSPLSRAVLADLMCLAHEGEPYGHLADKVGALTIQYMASRCVVTPNQFLKAIAELKSHKRIEETEGGVLFIRRMVDDEALRVRRAEGGKQSIGHPNTHPPKPKEGYPSDDPSLKNDSRERARADSDSGSEKTKKITFQQDFDDAWVWIESEYPGQINHSWDSQIFSSVVQTFEDIANLRRHLPLWKKSRNWKKNFIPTLENFLRKRMFEGPPKDLETDEDPAANLYYQLDGHEEERTAAVLAKCKPNPVMVEWRRQKAEREAAQAQQGAAETA